MSAEVHSRSGSLAVQAIIAGVIGAIVVDTYLSIRLQISPVALEAHTARIVAGPGTSPALGLVIHLTIALVWALIYAFVFNAIGQLQNWIAGTLVLGVAVDAVMNFLIALKTGAPWGSAFVNGLITNVLFYALPVTLYLSWWLRQRRASSRPPLRP